MFEATSSAFSSKFFPEPSSRGSLPLRALESEMIYAAADGDLAAMRRLQALGIELDVAGYDLRTPLHLAAAEGRLEVVRFLLERGIDVAPRDRWGATPQQDAHRNGHWRIAQLLDASPEATQDVTPCPIRLGDVGVFRCIE